MVYVMIYCDPTTGEFTADEFPTAEDLFQFVGRIGRAHGPAVLYDLDGAGLLDGEEPAAVLPVIWAWADDPAQQIDAWVWESWFEPVGYRDAHGDVLPQPESIRLYRGCSADEVDDGWGMSWTDDLEVAQKFACRNRGQVFTAEVPDYLLLADLTGDPRAEREYIVSGTGLDGVELLDEELAA